MSAYTLQEMGMVAKWWGNRDLLDNEEFWRDCKSVYQDKLVRLPLADSAETRARVNGLVKCPPGECGACCRYDRVALSPSEREALSGRAGTELRLGVDSQGQTCLVTRGGCQFLVNNICTVYDLRPQVCSAFPIVAPRESQTLDGVAFKQMQMRLRCGAAIDAARAVLQEAVSRSRLLLLPDLSLVPLPAGSEQARELVTADRNG